MRDFLESVGGLVTLVFVIGSLLALWVSVAYAIGVFIGIASRGFHLVA